MKTKLYEHQLQGVDFIRTQQKCILAFDMGLGKTKTAIHGMYILDRIVIICPSRLVENWKDELIEEKEDDIQIIKTGKDKLGDAKWIIISYDLVKDFTESFVDFDGVIIDESHYIKGKSTRSKKTGKPSRARAVIEVCDGMENVVLLTGTPIMNKPVELWNQLKAIDHELTHNKKKPFSERYCRGHFKRMGRRAFWWEGGASNLEELAEKIKDKVFMLKKRDVLDLPEMRIHKVLVTLTKQERKEYEKQWSDYIQWVTENIDEYVQDEEKARVLLEAQNMGMPEAIAEEFLRVQLVGKMNDARQIIETQKLMQITSAVKQKVVMNMLDETGDQQVVVFAQFVKTLADLNDDLKKSEHSHTTLKDGKIKDFQDGKYKVFTSNLIAGGTGLNMQSASTMFNIDQHWTPGINEQAYARIERMGQVRTMDIYVMVCKDTVDEIVWDRNMQKKKTINTIEEVLMEK